MADIAKGGPGSTDLGRCSLSVQGERLLGGKWCLGEGSPAVSHGSQTLGLEGGGGLEASDRPGDQGTGRAGRMLALFRS